MGSPTQSYPLVRSRPVVTLTAGQAVDDKPDEGVEIDVASILSEEEAKEPALEAKIDETTVDQSAQEPALQANTDQTNEQPAEEPAKESEMNQQTDQTIPDTAANQGNLATFHVVGQPLPPEQDMTMNQKPTAEPFFKFWRIKMSGRDFCLFLLIVAMAVTIVYLLAVRTTSSTKLPPAIIVEEPASRRAIIVDGGSTKPAADMATVAVNDLANNATPAEDLATIKPTPRMPAAAQGKPVATKTVKLAEKAPATLNSFDHNIGKGEGPSLLEFACSLRAKHEGKIEKLPTNSVELARSRELNNASTNDKLPSQIGDLINVSCDLEDELGKKAIGWAKFRTAQIMAARKKAAEEAIK